MTRAAKDETAWQPAVRVLDRVNGWYTVPSERRPAVAYNTCVRPGAVSCTCPAGTHSFVSCKAGHCKHVAAARAVADALLLARRVLAHEDADLPFTVDLDAERVILDWWDEHTAERPDERKDSRTDDDTDTVPF